VLVQADMALAQQQRYHLIPQLKQIDSSLKIVAQKYNSVA
jgi:hypothetical protein